MKRNSIIELVAVGALMAAPCPVVAFPSDGSWYNTIHDITFAQQGTSSNSYNTTLSGQGSWIPDDLYLGDGITGSAAAQNKSHCDSGANGWT